MAGVSVSDVLGEEDTKQEDFSTALESAAYQPFSFTTKRFVLQDLIDAVLNVVPKDGSVLANIQARVSPDRLVLYATDMELSIIASSEAVIADAEAVVVLPARRLASMLKEAPEGALTLAVSGSEATLSVGPVRWKMRLSDGSAFPEAPYSSDAVEFHTVPRQPFAQAIKSVRYAMCKDGSRPPLMMIDVSGNKVTACDGARIQQVKLDFPLDMQIPASAVDHVLRLLSGADTDDIRVAEVERSAGGSAVIFRVGETSLIVSKLTARFPDMDKLLLKPTLENNLPLVVDRAELVDAIRRVRINADTETSAIGLRLESSKLTVVSKDKYGNGAEESLEAGWDGQDRMVFVNHQFLLEMLQMYDGKSCTFKLGKDTKQRKSALLLQDAETGVTGVIQQMLGKLIGY